MRCSCRIAVVAVFALALAASVQAQIIVAPALPVRPIPIAPPDLQISNLVMTSPATLHCGTQTISFTAVETNAGPSPAAAHHIDVLKSTGAGFFVTCRIAVGSLAGNTSRNLALSCTFWNGPCDCLPTTYTSFFQLFTDSLLAVAESNEGNNTSNIAALASACP